MKITIETILQELEIHNRKAIPMVKKAYALAAEIHKEQKRQSGEPYIIHPLTVAKNLLDMEIWDQDTICAALLHDTIEDSDLTKEDIAKIINEPTAELVDGVTKISRMNFTSKNNQNLANTRKIITGLNKDVRIILIKLADRLHNMRTLEFKSPQKQKENAIETMEVFVPLAYSIGAYRIKSELEDLSLMYIEPDEYKKIEERKIKMYKEFYPDLKEMLDKIKRILNDKHIPNKIKFRTKNIFDTYKKIKQGYKLENIYDLYYLKILVDEIDSCFITLGVTHKEYLPISNRFKDYIYNPRTNLYQSIHTTVSGTNNRMTKIKIRTFDMDKVAAFGVPALWNLENGFTREETQKELLKENQFAKRLRELDKTIHDNQEFISSIRSELLTEHVYPYSESGKIIELPKGSTILDFAYAQDETTADKMIKGIVNEKEVGPDYQVGNNDYIKIITGEEVNKDNWDQFAYTIKAQEKIKALQNNKQII